MTTETQTKALQFLVSSKKRSKQHIVNRKTGMAFCKVENNSKKTRGRYQKINRQSRKRAVCTICIQLYQDPRDPFNNGERHVTEN